MSPESMHDGCACAGMVVCSFYIIGGGDIYIC